MTYTDAADRRRAPRTPVTLLVQHRTSLVAEPETDYASDLSESGIFIRTSTRLAEGETFQISFSPVKDARLVEAYCRVARVTGDGFGAEFIQLDGDSAVLLSRALSS